MCIWSWSVAGEFTSRIIKGCCFMSDFSPFGGWLLCLENMPGEDILNGHRFPQRFWKMTRRWPPLSQFELMDVFHICCRCDGIEDYWWIGSGCGIFTHLRWDGCSRGCNKGCSRELSAPLYADIHYTTLVPIDLMHGFIGGCWIKGKGARLVRLDASFTFVGGWMKDALLLRLSTCHTRHLMECKQMKTKW